MPIMPMPIIGLSSKVRQATADFTSGSASVASCRGKRVIAAFSAVSGLKRINSSIEPAERRAGPIIGIIMPGPWPASGAVTRSTERPSPKSTSIS